MNINSEESEKIENEIKDLLQDKCNWRYDDFDMFGVRFAHISDDDAETDILYVKARSFSKLDVMLLAEYAKEHGMNEFNISTDGSETPVVSIEFYSLLFKLDGD